jgi:TnpA family transposase
VLADAINLGVTRMADACPGISPSKLVRINTLYIRDETYTKARAQIVNYHHELAFAGNFGQGRPVPPTLSVFARGGRGEATGRINPRYWPHTG